MYRIRVRFCLYGMFLPVTPSFHTFRIRRPLIFELICESDKIHAFQKSRINQCWTGYWCFIFASIQTPRQLHPLTMSSLKYTCFHHTQGVCYQFGSCNFLRTSQCRSWKKEISLLYRSTACLQMAIKQSSLFQYSCVCAYGHHHLDWWVINCT